MIRIEILCTGDEILSGKTVNTNYSHMARRITEAGLEVASGTTVGDDRAALVAAMREAAVRSDAVVVNGGLGPTVDDLSQEAAAEAAGVPLELDGGWLQRIEAYYADRGRRMPTANRKQAMLPTGARILDNPIGTACGFSLPIADTPFFFTPGVPREMRLMFDELVVPALKSIAGTDSVTRVKRFHSFGIGESRADELLRGVVGQSPAGDIKLGFQSHYPQLETKLTAHAASRADLDLMLDPVAAEVRDRLGDFIVSEDDQSLEQAVLDALAEEEASLAIMETHTGGSITARLMAGAGSERVLRRGVVSCDMAQLAEAAGLEPAGFAGRPGRERAVSLAEGLRRRCESSHALVVLTSPAETSTGKTDRGDIYIGISYPAGAVARKATLAGGEDWVRLGAAELGLDCLRRYFCGLAVDQRIDFEIR